MNTGAFLTCLGYYEAATGASASLEGVYSPSSGTTGILYNQLYPTGYHYSNGLLYAPALPFINIWNTQVTNNTFSGNNGFRAGYQHSGNFGILLDIEYSGCENIRGAANNGRGLILLSTVENHSGFASGFMIGIDAANHLYFKTLNKQSTLDYPLTTRDFVFVSLTENQYVDFGIYRPIDQQFYVKNVNVGSPTLSTTDIYLGNFRNNNVALSQCTGFKGKINNIFLFNDDLDDPSVKTCAECSFATGYQNYAITQNFSGNQITGVYFSGVQVLATTGYVNKTGQVKRSDGVLIDIVYPSGLTGYQTTGTVATPLSQTVALNVVNSGYRFLYDTGQRNGFSLFSITLGEYLVSGDVVEIYSYPLFDSRIGNHIEGTAWPDDTGEIQLICNGINETKDVDYYVVRNEVSGFFDEDNLSYDIYPSGSIVTTYSGYWQNSRILMSGGAWYPTAPQYVESTTAFSGQVKITGLNKICTGNPYYPSFGYDLWMNGQKLVSGWQYSITASGAQGFVVSLSGKDLPLLMIDAMYDPTGGLPTGIEDTWASELTFSPQYSGFYRALYSINTTQNTISYITGFSEQVWVNGVRQLVDHDYIRSWPCDQVTGIVDFPSYSYVAYDSQTDIIGKWQ
jgi:hypothetical protein